MPFNGSGTFSILNTFTPNTTILSSPVNANFVDIASGLSDCLTRDGQAGMTAVLKLITGSVSAPALSFTADTNTGFYDAGADNPAMAAGGVQQQNWTSISSNLVTGVVESGSIAPTSISTQKNDYAPTGIDTASVIRQASSATTTITGLAGLAAGTAAVAGRRITIININALGSGFNLILSNQSTSSLAANRFSMGGDLTLYPKQAAVFWMNPTSGFWDLISSFTFQGQSFQVPEFRLTLTTATPVLTTDSQSSTIYYTPYTGGYLTTWDGSVWTGSVQSEVSQTLADNTKSPSAATSGNNYDYFYWLDSGTFRCTRGPAWTSGTARGSGAGTTELVRVNGVWMNANAITNGAAAQRGVYVGTIATQTGPVVNMQFNVNAAAGGTLPALYLWNMYNRVLMSSMCKDSTDSWTYTTKTWRAANNSNSNRVLYVLGLNEDSIRANYLAIFSNTSGSVTGYAGIGLDVTNAFSGIVQSQTTVSNSATTFSTSGFYYGASGGIGQRFVQAIEASTASGTTTWYGDNAEPTFTQTGLTFTTRM